MKRTVLSSGSTLNFSTPHPSLHAKWTSSFNFRNEVVVFFGIGCCEKLYWNPTLSYCSEKMAIFCIWNSCLVNSFVGLFLGRSEEYDCKFAGGNKILSTWIENDTPVNSKSLITKTSEKNKGVIVAKKTPIQTHPMEKLLKLIHSPHLFRLIPWKDYLSWFIPLIQFL